MKKIFLRCFWFIPFLLLGYSSFAQDCECYPEGKDSLYMYYLNLNIPAKENFTKEDLRLLFQNSKNKEKERNDFLEREIFSANKSFQDDMGNDFLKRSISVYSKNKNLKEDLQKYKDVSNLVEFVCAVAPEKRLLYQPNDYQGMGMFPNDPRVNSHLELIRAKEAWDLTKGDKRVKIGIPDTYMETTHTDLKDKLSAVLQNSPFPEYHGVTVAGCAAAHTDNNNGISGIGFNCPIVFTSDQTSAQYPPGFNAYIPNVLYNNTFANINGVRVINFSFFTGCSYSATQEQWYISYRDTKNIVLVGGAGNTPMHCGDNGRIFPNSYDAFICVTSVGHIHPYGTPNTVNWKDVHSENQNDTTDTHHHHQWVDICAPGYNVLTTSLNNSYGGVWGTSFSGPIVTGVCALVISANPCLTAAQVQNVVVSTANPLLYLLPENEPFIGLLGQGRVDAYEAVKKAIELGTIYVQNKTYTGTASVTAQTIIKAGYNVTSNLPYGNVIVQTGSKVNYTAYREIVLSSGFVVQNDSQFEAKVIDSPCY